MERRSAAFGLAMGIIMGLVWIVLLAAGQYDLQTAPFEAVSLLAAEGLTVVALGAGGIGILGRRRWGTVVHLASLGMMLYTAVNSIGVFAQAGVLPASLFFVGLTLATMAFLIAWAPRAIQ